MQKGGLGGRAYVSFSYKTTIKTSFRINKARRMMLNKIRKVKV